MKTKLVILIAFVFTYNIQAQFSSKINKDDVQTFLMLQGIYDYAELEVKANSLYNLYLQKNSYKFTDLLSSSSLSILSGIGLGAYESNTFWGYDQIDWMPSALQKWYLASQDRNSGSPNYNLFSWQFVFREIDYVADRAAYDNWMTYFENKWWWALLTHWTIKNIASTLVKDTFLHDKPFYSFQIDLIIGLRN